VICTVRDAIRDHVALAKDLERLSDVIARVASSLITSIEGGGKVLWAGNGGSAADCQHLAAELVGRFRCDRRAIASIALTTDSSVLTAVANDSGFENVFARQVEALCLSNDCLVCISTSGASPNILAALRSASNIGACTVLLTGHNERPGVLTSVDHCIYVPSRDTARIQEMHLLIGHILCQLIERACCARLAPHREP